MRSSSGGPCNHCGRTVTPCWRKGPPEKPILCNACGARYLVKHTLDGYMPGQKTSIRLDKVEPPTRMPPCVSSLHSKRRWLDYSRCDSDKEESSSDYERCDKASPVSSSGPSIFFDCTTFDFGVSLETFDRAHAGAKRSKLQSCSAGLCFPLFQADQDPGDLAATTLALLQSSAEATLSQPLFQRRPRKQAKPVACAI